MAQNPSISLTPDGVLDQVFDRYGNCYQLMNLQIPNNGQPVTSNNNRFNVYFENGSGMELSNNSTHLARRQVLLKVLEDVSNFIDLPISTNKVNILVRSMSTMTTAPATRLSMGSSYYNVVKSNTADIADGEVWKTILSGVNSYSNLVSFPNQLYHGALAFNFSTYNGITVNWHTALNTATASSRYDLYTAMLKEVMHLLGLTSLMGPDGKSIFQGQYQYYSRFDKHLITSSGTQLLKHQGNIEQYNYSFSSALSPTILRPGCSLPNFTNPNTADNTSCSQAIYYRNSVFVPVYTPTCFENGNSLTCFEDQLYPSCSSPQGNNRYFVTSNRLNFAQHKRFPKPEERLILIDLGYKLKTTFGSSTTFGGTTNYGNEVLGNQQVVGVNDGINPDLTFTFYGEVNQNITISGAQLLSNDTNANAFEGLQTVNSTATLSSSLGNNSTSITINSQEGDFEEFSQMPNNISQINRLCNWQNFNINGTPDFFHRNTTNPAQVGVPTNFFGAQENSNPLHNHGYAGYFYTSWAGEIFRTQLSTPLIAGQEYTLSFDISKSENFNGLTVTHIEAFITNQNFGIGVFPFLNPTMHLSNGMHLVSSPITNNQNNWENISITFTANGGERYLYLGGLTPDFMFFNTTVVNNQQGYYYIDNILLQPSEIDIVANPDNFTFSFSTNNQTSAISVLGNDLINGNPIVGTPYLGVTVNQLGNLNPMPANGGINLNPNGTIEVLSNTNVGTYIMLPPMLRNRKHNKNLYL